MSETPMDNNKQAVDIKGYRVLSEREKEEMNVLKAMEASVLGHLQVIGDNMSTVNQRSLAIAKTEIQTGFMWAVRAIARPNGE